MIGEGAQTGISWKILRISGGRPLVVTCRSRIAGLIDQNYPFARRNT